MDHLEKLIKDWNESPDLKCNHCGLVFKGSHACDYEKLKEKVERYEKALSFYADKKNWEKKLDKYMGFQTWDESNVESDKGKIAKFTLRNNGR
jgi:uncharacterized Zn finger protein